MSSPNWSLCSPLADHQGLSRLITTSCPGCTCCPWPRARRGAAASPGWGRGVSSWSARGKKCSQWNSHCEFYSECEVFCKRPHISYTLLEKTHIVLPSRSSTNTNQFKLSKNCTNLSESSEASDQCSIWQTLYNSWCCMHTSKERPTFPYAAVTQFLIRFH